MALQRTISLLPGVENRRAGRVFGDDGAERIVRTFHARFASIKCGGTTTARQAAEYVLRESKHAGDGDENKADVEAAAGDKEAMLADARRIRQTARITRGPTGERILATQIIELPAESTKEQRQACAQAFVDDWRERGHQAIAVVHMHGHDKDRPQPHLHVLATGRPVAADGTVDRSAPLWRNRDEVKAERARTARLVNEHCHTVAAFHPGGFKDIGREEDTPKWRTPTGVYLKVVAAEAGGAGWEEKEEAGRAQYAAARKSAELAEPKRTRKKEIAAARERGEKPPRVRPTLRQRLARAEADRSELAADLDRLAADRARQAAEKQQAETRADKAEADRVVSAKAVVYWCGRVGEVRGAVAERARQAAQALDEQRKRADNAEAALPGAVERATTAEGRVRELEELNKTQTKYATDWHGERGEPPPNLTTVEGRSLAWANMRAWEIEERKRRKDEAAAKKAELDKAREAEQKKTQEKIGEAVRSALEKERSEARQQAEAAPGLTERAEKAEAQLKAFAAGLGFTETQLKGIEKRAALAMERGERQARVDMGRRLEEHCSPIWRTPSSTARRLADAVFDEGPDAAASLVEDPPAIGTVRAQPDFSGTAALVAAIHQAAESVDERPGRPLEREKHRALNAEDELRKTQLELELAQAARDAAVAEQGLLQTFLDSERGHNEELRKKLVAEREAEEAAERRRQNAEAELARQQAEAAREQQALEIAQAPRGEVEAWQLTPAQFLNRRNDRSATRDHTDASFDDVVPSIHIHYAPGNQLSWKNTSAEAPPWLFERGGPEPIRLGFRYERDQWDEVALDVHRLEVVHAIEYGKPVAGAIRDFYRIGDGGGGRGGDGGGVEIDSIGDSIYARQQERQITR